MNDATSHQAPQPTECVVRPLVLDMPDRGSGPVKRIELQLNCGHVYHVITGTDAFRKGVIERLVHTEGAAVVQADGGLIGNLKVWENLVLPAVYHGAAHDSKLEENARRLFAEFGISGALFEQLCATLPDHLNRFERRLCAFVRAMLTEPQIIVYDSLFDGLTREQTGRALSFDRWFHGRFPLGTSMHLTADLPTIPEMGAQRTFHL